MSKRHIVVLVVVAITWFLVRLVYIAPAPFVFDKINKAIAPQAVFVNPQGTIWDARVDSLNINTGVDNINFYELKWKLNFWRLFIGQLDIDIDTKPAEQYVKANIRASILGNIDLRNLNLKLNAQTLARSFSLPVKLRGDVSISSDSLQLRDKKIVSLADNSEIKITQAGFNFNQEVLLGDYVGKLAKNDEQSIDIVLKDLDATLKANGKINVGLIAPRKYTVDVLLEPTAQFPADLKSMLATVATVNAQGQYHIKKSN